MRDKLRNVSAPIRSRSSEAMPASSRSPVSPSAQMRPRARISRITPENALNRGLGGGETLLRDGRLRKLFPYSSIEQPAVSFFGSALSVRSPDTPLLKEERYRLGETLVADCAHPVG